jgi:hypothetical protein
MPDAGFRELLRCNDPVTLGFAEALLRDCGIAHFCADYNMSVLDGSIGALQRRLLVDAQQFERAVRTLEDAGLGGEVRRGAAGP